MNSNNNNNNNNSLQHLNNQVRSSVDSKGHDQREDHRSSSRPPPLIPPNRSSHNDLDRTEKPSETGLLFRPYDVLLSYRYSNHQYPEATKTERGVGSYDNANNNNNTSGTRGGRNSEHPNPLPTPVIKTDPSNDPPSSARHRNPGHDEHQQQQQQPQFDVNSSICSQVVTKGQSYHQRELSNHHYNYFRSGLYDHSLSGHINSVVDASFHVFPEPSQSVLSKLDVDERKMRDSRLNGTYCSDSEEDEEIVAALELERKQQLTIIVNGPPIPLDTSRNKLRYLKSMGLTTHSRRRDLELERYRKRRRRLREGSVSPLPRGESDKGPVPPTPISNGLPLPIPPADLSEQLCMQPDYRNKCRFLHSLNLAVLTSEKKKELQAIQQACEEERARRLGLVIENPAAEQQREGTGAADAQKRSKPVLLDSLPQRTKRKHSEIEGSASSSSSSSSSQVANKLDHHHPHHHHQQQHQQLGSRPKISLNQLHERHLAAAAALAAASTSSSSSSSSSSQQQQQQQQQHYHKASSISTPTLTPPPTATTQPGVNCTRSNHETPRPLIFPESRGESRDHRRLSEKFAQEFHESVLASTFSNKSANGQRAGMKIIEIGPSGGVGGPGTCGSSSSSNVKSLGNPDLSISSLSSLPVHPSHKASVSSLDPGGLTSRADEGRVDLTESTSSSTSSPVAFKWPGVETILEAYQRHLDEQKLERLILHDRCQKLKTDNFDLKKTAEKLSRKVSNLLDSKSHDEEEYRRFRSSVDTLKHYYFQLPR